MILFERERRALDFAVKHVKRLRPGERITLTHRDLIDIPKMEHNGATWNPADRVLENITSRLAPRFCYYAEPKTRRQESSEGSPRG